MVPVPRANLPEQPDFMIVMDDIWDGLASGPEYARKQADQESYAQGTGLSICFRSQCEASRRSWRETNRVRRHVRYGREHRSLGGFFGRSIREFLEQATANDYGRGSCVQQYAHRVYVIAFQRTRTMRVSDFGTRHQMLDREAEVGKGTRSSESGSANSHRGADRLRPHLHRQALTLRTKRAVQMQADPLLCKCSSEALARG